MISSTPLLTNSGRDLMIRGISGELITFTRFKIGSGDVPPSGGAGLTDLVNPDLSFMIDEVDTSETGFIHISGHFSSGDIASDFRWKELGIFAKGEDDAEKLYAYCNDGVNAGMLKAGASSVVMEQKIVMIVAIGTANVTAIIRSSELYASKDAFDAHLDASNPHDITPQGIGAAAQDHTHTAHQVGIIYSAEEPEVVEGGIWLKPVT